MEARRIRMSRFALAVILCAYVPASVFAGEPRLFIDWPPDWELRQSAQREQQALYVQGRHRNGARVLQELTMTLIDITGARKPVTNGSIKDLAQRFRGRFPKSAGIGELQSFSNECGYYFIVTDSGQEKSPKYAHLIEGVMLDSGYLMEFVLETNDARAPDTVKMLNALADFEIR